MLPGWHIDAPNTAVDVFDDFRRLRRHISAALFSARAPSPFSAPASRQDDAPCRLRRIAKAAGIYCRHAVLQADRFGRRPRRPTGPPGCWLTMGELPMTRHAAPRAKRRILVFKHTIQPSPKWHGSRCRPRRQDFARRAYWALMIAEGHGSAHNSMPPPPRKQERFDDAISRCFAPSWGHFTKPT